MEISFDRKVAASADTLINILGEEAVLLNLQSQVYFGLDVVGTRMWQVLTSTESIHQAFETLIGEYDVAPEQLRNDLAEFVGKLVERKLLEVVGE